MPSNYVKKWETCNQQLATKAFLIRECQKWSAVIIHYISLYATIARLCPISQNTGPFMMYSQLH